jgi:hypothetical protein
LGCGRRGWRLRAALRRAESESESVERVYIVIAVVIIAKYLTGVIPLKIQLRTMKCSEDGSRSSSGGLPSLLPLAGLVERASLVSRLFDGLI